MVTLLKSMSSDIKKSIKQITIVKKRGGIVRSQAVTEAGSCADLLALVQRKLWDR